MRLVGLQEDGLALLEVDDVEEEGAERAHVLWELLIEAEDKLLDGTVLEILAVRLARLALVALDELCQLGLDGLVRVGVHQGGEEGAERLLQVGVLWLWRLGGRGALDERGGRARHGRGECGRRVLAHDGREFWDALQEVDNLRQGAEAAEAGKRLADGNGHFRLE